MYAYADDVEEEPDEYKEEVLPNSDLDFDYDDVDDTDCGSTINEGFEGSAYSETDDD